MDLAVWIVGGWLGVSILAAFAVASFIRDNRGASWADPMASFARRADRA